jgi:hypothetical protein
MTVEALIEKINEVPGMYKAVESQLNPSIIEDVVDVVREASLLLKSGQFPDDMSVRPLYGVLMVTWRTRYSIVSYVHSIQEPFRRILHTKLTERGLCKELKNEKDMSPESLAKWIEWMR